MLCFNANSDCKFSVLDMNIGQVVPIRLTQSKTTHSASKSSRLSSDLQNIDENDIICLSEPDILHVTGFAQLCDTRPQFAWKLAKFLFSNDELLGCNCYGKMGKYALDPKKLTTIFSLVFQYFPEDDLKKQAQLWSRCTISIDQGIRNLHKKQLRKNRSVKY